MDNFKILRSRDLEFVLIITNFLKSCLFLTFTNFSFISNYIFPEDETTCDSFSSEEESSFRRVNWLTSWPGNYFLGASLYLRPANDMDHLNLISNEQGSWLSNPGLEARTWSPILLPLVRKDDWRSSWKEEQRRRRRRRFSNWFYLLCSAARFFLCFQSNCGRFYGVTRNSKVCIKEKSHSKANLTDELPWHQILFKIFPLTIDLVSWLQTTGTFLILARKDVSQFALWLWL